MPAIWLLPETTKNTDDGEPLDLAGELDPPVAPPTPHKPPQTPIPPITTVCRFTGLRAPEIGKPE